MEYAIGILILVGILVIYVISLNNTLVKMKLTINMRQ